MTDRKRVLWLTPDKPDNISVGRQRIADHLEKRGLEVTLRGTTMRTILRSLRERGKYDAIVGTTRAGAFAGVLLQFVHRRPLVVDHVDPIRQFEETHPNWLAPIVRLLENGSFRMSDRVLYVYDEEYERISRYASDVNQTQLGVEYDRFSNPDEEIVAEAATMVESQELDDRVAIYVGGLEPIYHIRHLLAAITRLDGWSLLVLGDGTMSSLVRDTAARRNDVAYFGTVPNERVPGYLHAADVGISLVDDPHTLKVLEYGAAGLAVVQIAGRAKARFGDRVEYCDATPESIAAAIERADDRDSADALRSYVSQFDWEEVTNDYARALEAHRDERRLPNYA